MAAFSVYSGNKENRVHFTVRWDVLKADGHCQVSRQGMVKNVDIIKFHNNRKNMTVTTTSQRRVMVSTTTGISESVATADGGVCHSCTPENAFMAPAKYRSQDHGLVISC